MARSVRPLFWGRFALVPHREPGPRQQCRDCAGGGEINGLTCRGCNGRGWHDASHPPPRPGTEADVY